MSSLEPEAPYRGCLEVEASTEEELPRVKRGAWREPSDFGSPGVWCKKTEEKKAEGLSLGNWTRSCNVENVSLLIQKASSVQNNEKLSDLS